ncbi:MAG TPA: hypothetical protein VK988_01875 [Acidimicrobiales bacterium]|nr:hypothetical protein [Acidimicrobiales bacterium]
MSDVDDEQTKSDTPVDGTNDDAAPATPVITAESGSEESETPPVEQPAPGSDGAGGQAHGTEHGDGSPVVAASETTVEEEEEKVEEPAPKADAPAAGDGVKEDAPVQGPDDQAAPAAPVIAAESGSEKTETPPVEQPAPGSDGADGQAHDGEHGDGSPAVAASETTVEEEEEKVEEPAPKADAPAAGDGVKEVSRGRAGPRGEALRHYWPFAVLGLTTLVLVVGLFVAISGDKEPSPSPSDKPRPAAQGPMETFTDPEGGFTLRYPKAWRRIPVPSEGSDLRLVLSTGRPEPGAAGGQNPTGNDGMWVRVIAPDKIDQKINEFDAEIKALTGDKACGAEGSACLRQERVTIAGMNGVRYIYTSPDVGGQNSVHVQYFLRRGGGNLYVLVFQAVPPTDLEGLAPSFDEVLASFQAPDPGPAGTTTTTTK